MATIIEEQEEKMSILEERAVATLGIELNQDTITHFSDKSMQEIKDMDDVEFITYLCETGKLEYFTVDSDLTCRKKLSQVPYRYRDSFAERFLRDLNDKDIVLEGRNNEKENAFLNQLTKIGVYITSIDDNIPFIYDMTEFESVISNENSIKGIELYTGEKIGVRGSLSSDKQRKKLVKIVREELNGMKKERYDSESEESGVEYLSTDIDDEDVMNLTDEDFEIPSIDFLDEVATEFIENPQSEIITSEIEEKGNTRKEKTPEEIQENLKNRFGIEVPLEKCKTYLQAYNTISRLSTVNTLRVIWREDIWKEIGEAKDFEEAMARGEKIDNKTVKAFYFRYFLPGLEGRNPTHGATYEVINGVRNNVNPEVTPKAGENQPYELGSEPSKIETSTPTPEKEPEKELEKEPEKESEKEQEKETTKEPEKEVNLKGTYTPLHKRPDWHMRSIEEMEIEAYLRKPGDIEREEKEEERWLKRMKNFYDRSKEIAQKDKQTILKAIEEIKENHKSTGPIDRD